MKDIKTLKKLSKIIHHFSCVIPCKSSIFSRLGLHPSLNSRPNPLNNF